ncbi:LicD family protein [Streptococcus parauberis]|uniref:LicD family protein n=1 Tax=Streptococcus parauberis TaxID=1348 RepID=UPI00288FC464|nr:LicD family protein [Streptococcus parauberis]MDT2748630.1 LicD family protein [Streptococcus parauberis]
MPELDLKEVQHKALELLVEFDKICRKNEFIYSLGGGTLLGAIRHNGFIPWDDDIDLMMPRPDYEKFLGYCANNETPFDCFSINNIDDYDDLFAKISDKDTIIVDEMKWSKLNMGVSIDIFPIDGLGRSLEEAIKNFNKTKFKRELLIAARWKKYFVSKTKSLKYEPIRFIFFCISRFIDKNSLSRKLNRDYQKISFSTSTYSGCISGVYREKEIMETHVFKDIIEIKFEDNKFLSIRDYDSYLELHYGNYMQLPPKDKQISHHTSKFYFKKDYQING